MGDFARRALTGIAALQAARRGISPDAFDATGQDARAQSALRLGGLLQDPGFQAAATANPQLAAQFGLPLGQQAGATFPGVSPDVGGGRIGPVAPSQGQAPIFPAQALTLDELRRQESGARMRAFEALTGQRGQQTGLIDQLLGGGGLEGGGSVGGLPLTGVRAGPFSFGAVQPQLVPAGSIGPAGPIQPGQALGGNRSAVITPATPIQTDISAQVPGSVPNPIIRRGVSGSDLQAESALNFFQQRISRIEEEFTPEQRSQFAGLYNFARERAKVIGSALPIVGDIFSSGDPNFIRFAALMGEMESFAFGEGGKQLTKNELDVIRQFLPRGRELGGPIEFETRLSNFKERLSDLQEARGSARQLGGPVGGTQGRPTGRALGSSAPIPAADFLQQ